MGRPKKKEEAQKSGSSVDLAIDAINKQFGQGTIQHLGQETHVPGIEYFDSGSISLNRALGGGIPKGRVVEIYGVESAGKSTLALSLIANALQEDERKVLYIDVEHALDPKYAKDVGVDMSRLLITQPNNGEDALNILEQVLRSGGTSVIVVDSVAALVPKAELEGQMGDQHIGLQARLMSQALRKITPLTKDHNTTVVFINQIRHKIGVMFGSPETTPGGNSLKFYASQRLEIRRKEKKENSITSLVKVVKNKVGAPFKQAQFDIRFGKGIDAIGDVLNIALEEGIVQKSGAWFSFEGENIGQGQENVIQFLNANPKIFDRIKSMLSS